MRLWRIFYSMFFMLNSTMQVGNLPHLFVFPSTFWKTNQIVMDRIRLYEFSNGFLDSIFRAHRYIASAGHSLQLVIRAAVSKYYVTISSVRFRLHNRQSLFSRHACDFAGRIRASQRACWIMHCRQACIWTLFWAAAKKCINPRVTSAPPYPARDVGL